VADPPPPTPHQFQDVLVRFAGLLEHSRITYMIVGAVAVGAWGRPRATADIDVTVLADETGLEAIVRAATGLGLEVDRHWMEWNRCCEAARCAWRRRGSRWT
jgi:hypothetical protein